MNDMEQKKKMPQVRFKGYDDTWEQRKLGEIAQSFEYGLNAAAKEYDGTNKYLRITDIDDASRKFNTDNLTSPDIEFSTAENFRLFDGDILFARTGASVGKSFIYRDSDGIVYFAGFLIRARIKMEYDAEFVFQNTLCESYGKYIQITSQRSGQPGVNAKEYSDYVFYLPTYDEQKKIGNFLHQIDNLITLHQRKYDKLIKMKRAMLEKMFPKNGSLYPEIRFEGFTDAWEQRKLENISDVKDGTHDSPKYVQNGHPFITSKNVGDGFINYDDIQYVSDKDYDEINRRSKVDIHDILMGMIGTIGNLALIREKPDFAIKNVALIKYTGDIDYKFLYQILQSHCVTSQLLNSIDGGTQKFIALNKIRGLDIPYPGEEEQRKIGLFFEQLDNLITLHQRKLEKLKNIKKACLEKMFV